MTSLPHSLRPDPVATRDPGRISRPLRVLAGLELFTGVTALAGGVLLAIAPDGSLLAADPAALVNNPFPDYRWPGILLAALVGGGFLLTGAWQWRGGRGARALSVVAGLGLIVLEASELLWIGFQPLEAVMAVIGAVVVALAVSVAPENGRTR